MPSRLDESLSTIDQSIAEFGAKTEADIQKLDGVLTSLDTDFRALDECARSHATQKREHKRIRDMLAEVTDDALSKSDDESLRLALARRTQNLCDAWETQRSQVGERVKVDHGSHFLRFALGKVNVRAWKQKDKIKLKEEYNKFKFRTTILFIVFPVVQLLVECGQTMRTLHHLWLLYYYSSLAVRENILNVNGSKIQSWWIDHHYVSILIAGVTMSVPDDVAAYYMNRGILKFFILQGVVMYLQNKYQSGRQYARVAIGKASPIDVSASETLIERPSTESFMILVPLLYITYFVELMAGAVLVADSVTQRTFSWQVFVIGLAWIVVGAGNSLTVISVIRRRKQDEEDELEESERRKLAAEEKSQGVSGGGSRRATNPVSDVVVPSSPAEKKGD